MSEVTTKDKPTNFSTDLEIVKSESKLHQSRSIIREFSLNTSMHGIAGISRSQSIHNRIFWSIAILIFTGMMFYFSIQAIRAYFKYPTEISVEFIEEWPQAFPAVTICNYSPLRYDQFIMPYLNYTNTFNLTNTNDTSTFSALQAEHISNFLNHELNRNQSLHDLYYPLEAMLIKCVYNGVNCSVHDFIRFISPRYGFCYTFNAQAKHINNGKLHYNNENGKSGQLELDLYTHSHQYVPYLSNGVGIVAMVHENTQLPLIDRASTQLRPGQRHKLGYIKMTNVLLPAPYTTCNNKVSIGLQAMFNQFPQAEYTYAQELCFIVAIQTYTYQECGCVSPFEWSTRYIVLPGTTTVIHASLCNTSDICYANAADRFRSSSSIARIFASDCNQECSINKFLIKLSSIAAPTSWYLNDIKNFVESVSTIPLSSNWSTTWSSDIQANYVGIDVVCESTRVETYTQQASISVVDVISNVGGQTGLWMGISFLSLMEIIEMLYRLIRYQYHRIRRRLQQ
ncbi:unnamed protein product [Adineta steineri]|uniref:Uncharacterized protein n=3 Tax=Adineta steineri TaxID=433720 RepID=A0A815E424_9BILA|nr:unnamed protein product [Adineta steineri]CAF3730651.1 unnamed protein product [Adineta steineri]